MRGLPIRLTRIDLIARVSTQSSEKQPESHLTDPFIEWPGMWKRVLLGSSCSAKLLLSSVASRPGIVVLARIGCGGVRARVERKAFS